MRTKSFIAGEAAIGGIIKVITTNTIIKIQALDQSSREIVESSIFVFTRISYGEINYFLNKITNSYYAEVVMTYIERETGFSKRLPK